MNDPKIMSDEYDLPERLNEQSRLWAESPTITVEQDVTTPEDQSFRVVCVF